MSWAFSSDERYRLFAYIPVLREAPFRELSGLYLPCGAHETRGSLQALTRSTAMSLNELAPSHPKGLLNDKSVAQVSREPAAWQ